MFPVEKDEKEDETVSEFVTNAVFICKRCGKLTIASEILWKRSSRHCNSKSRRMTFSTKTPRTITILLSNNVHWKYLRAFSESESALKDHVYFPVCNNCINFQIDTTGRQKEYLNFEMINMNRLFSTITPEFIEKVKNYVKSTNDQVSIVREVIQTSTIEATKGSVLPQHVLKTDQSKIITADRDKFHLQEMTVNTLDRINARSLVAATTFTISAYRHYGVINGARLGFVDFDGISATEVMTGLIEVCHLLQYFAKLVGLNVSSIRISSKITITIYEDDMPKQLVFEAKDMANKKGYKTFNLCVIHIMNYFSIILSCFDRGQPKCPFNILKEQCTIGGVSYLVDLKSPENWIQACKYLLTDFKTIQLQLLRKAMVSLSK